MCGLEKHLLAPGYFCSMADRVALELLGQIMRERGGFGRVFVYQHFHGSLPLGEWNACALFQSRAIFISRQVVIGPKHQQLSEEKGSEITCQFVTRKQNKAPTLLVIQDGLDSEPSPNKLHQRNKWPDHQILSP